MTAFSVKGLDFALSLAATPVCSLVESLEQGLFVVTDSSWPQAPEHFARLLRLM